jgi:predicted 3-demethylubiquinone-9 3-methyltransferase (glyoxalase superfamily)
MQKVTTFLWFNNQAKEAAKFYTSLFKNSKILNISHYPEAAAKASGQPKGSVMTVKFTLDGQEFVAMNGGPHMKLTEAVSLVVQCKNQKEIDKYWTKLSDGGVKSHCGWLKDKYGLSWQIVPRDLVEMISSKNGGAVQRFMAAVLQMDKLDMKALKKAFQG